MDDNQLIDAMARLWIEHGGDEEGISWCWRDIQLRIAEIRNGKEEKQP